MINISHVKKYEQSTPYSLNQFLVFIRFFFIFLVLSLTSCNTDASNAEIEEKVQKESSVGRKNTELPLEVSERFYKKGAILKFNEAVKKWESKSTNEAIELWHEAIKIDPNLWVAYMGLGQAYDSLKDYKKSLEAYTKYLELAPKTVPDRVQVTEAVKFLSHILRNGEDVLKGDNYLEIVKTKHQRKELYARWDLNKPVKIYFYPAKGVPNYREEFQKIFLEGAMIWQEVLPSLKLEVLDDSVLEGLSKKQKEKKEKELIEEAQIKVIFPSKFKIKGDPSNPIASQIDAQSYPVIRDKKNFRVLGVIMISPFIYFQSQIAIPLEPLSAFAEEEQEKKLKIIAAREIGHALGLWGFSPNPDDIMFEGEVSELELSDRDRNTMKKLYELDPAKDDGVLTN